MNNVWVLGASGLLGQAVRAELMRAKIAFVGTSRNVDVTDRTSLFRFSEAQRFSHIINCAAFTNVDGAEAQEKLAFAINADGAKNVALVASHLGATAVHVSTDFAFDGWSSEPYREDAEMRPLGAYARSKVAGEEAFLEHAARAIVVRTSWLFGSGAQNVVTRMLSAMAERDEVAMVADQVSRPTYANDLAAAIVSLAGLRDDRAQSATGRYHFANSPAVSRYEFARAIFQKARARGNMSIRCRAIRAVSSNEFPTLAQRPKYSVLDTTKIERALGAAPRHWSNALDDYFDALNGEDGVSATYD